MCGDQLACLGHTPQSPKMTSQLFSLANQPLSSSASAWRFHYPDPSILEFDGRKGVPSLDQSPCLCCGVQGSTCIPLAPFTLYGSSMDIAVKDMGSELWLQGFWPRDLGQLANSPNSLKNGDNNSV